MVPVIYHSPSKVDYTFGVLLVLNSLLPVKAKKNATGFGCRCFTDLDTIENNFGKVDIAEKFPNTDQIIYNKKTKQKEGNKSIKL